MYHRRPASGVRNPAPDIQHPEPKIRHPALFKRVFTQCLAAFLVFILGYSFHKYVDSLMRLDLGSKHSLMVETMDNSKNSPLLPQSIKKSIRHVYKPAPVEKYIVENADALGFGKRGRTKGCDIWKEGSPIHNDLNLFLRDLDKYNEIVANFEPIPDLRKSLIEQANDRNGKGVVQVCDAVKLDLMNIFESGQLSLSSSGYIEPLLPPMRHPRFCFKKGRYLLNMSYMVHDFEAMCKKLKPHSRTVLIDMGASLDYEFHKQHQPAVYLINLFEKFGIQFDHIYAYEKSFTEPDEVFQKVPTKLMPAYHWINVGVSSEEGNKINPLDTILRHFNEDDLIVVKLDIDTSDIEVPLAKQLLRDESLARLVDQFYFEHHVKIAEMAPIWRSSMNGSIKDSLVLFHGLREKGVPAHFWV